MVTLYHGTTADRLESILESGLIPPKCRARRDAECDCGYDEDEHGNFNYESPILNGNFGFIYFTENETSALGWANHSGGNCDDVVLAVEIPKADVEPDPIVPRAWRTPGPIPPERIRVCSVLSEFIALKIQA